jgi:hypothetical protein
LLFLIIRENIYEATIKDKTMLLNAASKSSIPLRDNQASQLSQKILFIFFGERNA